ncbi:MAG: hypothetical protein LBI28_12675 [Treponema sp.]|jgi:hypothetical protein|nr:hypothetical protein [Treponema sp.]
MAKTKIRVAITIEDHFVEQLKQQAAEDEVLVSQVIKRFVLKALKAACENPDAETKSYTFTTKKWREIESYAEAKCLGKMEFFVPFALERYMLMYPLKTSSKRQRIENIEE